MYNNYFKQYCANDLSTLDYFPWRNASREHNYFHRQKEQGVQQQIVQCPKSPDTNITDSLKLNEDKEDTKSDEIHWRTVASSTRSFTAHTSPFCSLYTDINSRC